MIRQLVSQCVPSQRRRALAVGAISFACVVAAFAVTRAPAQPGDGNDKFVTSGLNEQGEVRLLINRSTIITTNRPQKRLSVSEPSIVDVNGISPTRFLLTAKKPGATQVIVWDDQDRAQTIDVTVQPDITGLREQLGKIAGAQIEATTTDDTVILRGRAPSLSAAEQAAALSSAYGKRVVNLLEVGGGQQVMLQVRVAEVSKSATRALGMNFGFIDGPSIFGSNVGQISPLGFKEIGVGQLILGVPTSPPPAVNYFGKGEIGNTSFSYFLSALRDNNLLRILAEPNLIAISGQEASFLAGGEFPIPVPQSGTGNNTTITIQYREFGVKLNFVPIVLGDGRIRLRVSPEVSDLDFTTAVQFSGFVVPGLSQRKVTTTVEMNDGQTLAIAGLLNQNVTANKSVTPLLGDIPVIGALFRSVRYQRKETELAVFVTPRLVMGMSPDQVPAAPGENWRHPNEADLFLNQDLGGDQGGPSKTAATPARMYIGETGFAPATPMPSDAPNAAPATQPLTE